MHTRKTLINAMFGLYLLSNACTSKAAENENGEADSPDLEMLEFLGQFATEAGEWVEPDSLLSDEFAQLLEVADEINNQESAEPDNN